MTTDEILALLSGSVSSTGPISSANNQPMLDMINANKAELQPIVDQIHGKRENIANTESAFMDYRGNPSPAGMTIGDRMLGRESATMDDRLEAMKLGLNVNERTINPNMALDYTNSDLKGELEVAKNNIGGNINLGGMQGDKDELQSKMDNAAADRATDVQARGIKAGADNDAKYNKFAEDVTNYALQAMGKGELTPEAAFGIIKSNIPEASDDKINLMLGMPVGFSGGIQDYYNDISNSLTGDDRKAMNAINKLLNWQ